MMGSRACITGLLCSDINLKYDRARQSIVSGWMPLFARYRSLIGKYNYTVYFWIDLEIIRAIPQKIGKESYCLLKYWLKCMRASQGIYVNTETLKTKPFSINFKNKYFFHLPVSLFQSRRSFFLNSLKMDSFSTFWCSSLLCHF